MSTTRFLRSLGLGGKAVTTLFLSFKTGWKRRTGSNQIVQKTWSYVRNLFLRIPILDVSWYSLNSIRCH
jgi:hypothetical protein